LSLSTLKLILAIPDLEAPGTDEIAFEICDHADLPW
jgi:hypothetical protein